MNEPTTTYYRRANADRVDSIDDESESASDLARRLVERDRDDERREALANEARSTSNLVSALVSIARYRVASRALEANRERRALALEDLALVAAHLRDDAPEPLDRARDESDEVDDRAYAISVAREALDSLDEALSIEYAAKRAREFAFNDALAYASSERVALDALGSLDSSSDDRATLEALEAIEDEAVARLA